MRDQRSSRRAAQNNADDATTAADRRRGKEHTGQEPSPAAITTREQSCLYSVTGAQRQGWTRSSNTKHAPHEQAIRIPTRHSLSARGVSAGKAEVHAAIANQDQGLFPGAFAK